MLVGPGLGSGGAEVPAVAAEDPAAEVLDGAAATVAAALAALDGASLAHIAAHGRFREDSPLFSSLTLADGPLLVHDLQGLARPPHRVVLSACESGVMQPVGDQELLGSQPRCCRWAPPAWSRASPRSTTRPPWR